MTILVYDFEKIHKISEISLNMELLLLGTSGYGITPQRNLPSFLIDQYILFDCGEGTLQRLIQFGISIENIKAIFFTHLHPDHLSGLFALLFKLAFYNGNENRNVNRDSPAIYVPFGMKSHLLTLIENYFSPFERAHYKIKIIELSEKCDSPVEIQVDEKNYSIEWQRTTHNPVCNAYKINNSIVYTGDTSPYEEIIPFIKKCKLLLHDATFFDKDFELAHQLLHSTPIDVAVLAAKTDIQKVILIHLPDLNYQNESKFIEEAKKKFQFIHIGHDGDRFFI